MQRGLLAWMLWALSAPASAATIDERDIREMVAELIPEVERATGRPFVGQLSSGLASRERLRPALLAPPPQLVPPGMEIPWEPSPMERNRVEFLLDDALAVYVPEYEGVWVISDSVQELFDVADLPASTLRPVTRCVVAHELVHAMQHQYGIEPSWDTDPDLVSGYLALAEGHATLVALDLCRELEGEEIAELVDAIQGTAAPASLTADDPAAPYAWGRILAAALSEESAEVMWAGLAGDPPSWADIVEAVQGTFPPGWDDPTPLDRVLADLALPHVEDRVAGGPARMLGVSSFATNARSRVVGGWSVFSFATGEEGRVGAYLMAEPGAARELVDTRSSEIDREAHVGLRIMAEDLGGLLVGFSKGPFRKMRKAEGVTGTLRVRAGSSTQRYREYWVATDRVLLVVALNARRKERDVRDAMVALLDAMLPGPSEAPELEPLQEWLDDVRARAAEVRPVASWQYRQLRAARDVEDGSATACADWYGDVLGEPGGEAFAAAAFLCAATQDDLPTARTARALLPELDWVPGTWHAWRLVELGSGAEALEVLDAVSVPDDEARAAVADGRMYALIALRRWTAVQELAAERTASPDTLVFAATSLWNAGRVLRARTILDAVCPEVPKNPICREYAER